MKYQEDFDLRQTVLRSLSILGRQISSSASNLLNKNFGVSIVDWGILSVLARESELSAIELCQRTVCDKALVSRHLKSLNRAGYVKTKIDKKYGNKTQSSLTARGRKLYSKILPIAFEREQKLLSGFTKKEITTLKKMLFRMRENFPKLTDS